MNSMSLEELNRRYDHMITKQERDRLCRIAIAEMIEEELDATADIMACATCDSAFTIDDLAPPPNDRLADVYGDLPRCEGCWNKLWAEYTE